MAYVLLSVETGFMAQVMGKIRDMSQVKESYAVYGVYDVICKLELPSNEELQKMVSNIRHIEGVNATITMIIV